MAHSNVPNGNGHAESRRDEETPLLADQPKPSYGGDNSQTNGSTEERVVLVEDISTKRLYLILGSIYVGVFLGALGKYSVQNFRVAICRAILISPPRLDNHSHPYEPNIVVLL